MSSKLKTSPERRFLRRGPFLTLMALMTSAASSLAAGESPQMATLKDSVALPITTGSGSGSVTFPPGREVEVLAQEDTKYRVRIANLAEGWVEGNQLELKEAPPTEPGMSSDPVDSTQAEVKSEIPADGSMDTDAPPKPVSADWSTKKPQISATITDKIEREYSSTVDKCRGKRIAKTIALEIEGIDPEELQKAVLKTYAVLNTENLDFTTVNGVRTRLEPIEVKELTQKNQDASQPTYSHSQNNNECSCCKKRKKQHLSGFYTEVTAQDGTLLASYMSDLDRKNREFLEEHLGRKPIRN